VRRPDPHGPRWWIPTEPPRHEADHSITAARTKDCVSAAGGGATWPTVHYRPVSTRIGALRHEV